MATDLKQLLDGAEVKRKLWNTGSYTSSKIPDYEELVDIWEDYVYIRNASTFNGNNSKKVPNNGQIWPKKTLGFNTNNLYSASEATVERTVYFYDATWESNSTFSPQQNQTVLYTTDTSAASAGYYVEPSNSNTYRYYKTNNAGLITEIGLYERATLSVSPTILELDDSDSDTATITTNITNVAVLSIKKYPAVYDGTSPSAASGTLPTTTLRGSVSRNTFTAQSGSSYTRYAYPMVIFSIGGTKDGQQLSKDVLVHPVWYLDTSNVSAENLPAAGTTINPLNSTVYNVPSGSIEYTSKPTWVTISGQNLIVSQNTGSSSRSGTIKLRGYVNGGYEDFNYRSGYITSQFTISQLCVVHNLFLIIKMSDLSKIYLSTTSESITTVSAPRGFTVSGISIKDTNNVSHNANNVTFTTGATYRGLTWEASQTSWTPMSLNSGYSLSWTSTEPENYRLAGMYLLDI